MLLQGEEEEEDKWAHPVTKEKALEAGVMAEALDWLPPASNMTDGEEDLWQPHTQRNIKVKELRCASYLLYMASISTIYFIKLPYLFYIATVSTLLSYCIYYI
jgi:hypothetical protein